MPLLTVTGGPTPPDYKTLTAETKLKVYFFEPYVDNENVYLQDYEATLDLTSGGWKPTGTADGTPFKIPGAGNGDPVPPQVRLIEFQVYSDGTQAQNARELDGVFEDADTPGTWGYGSLPEGFAVVYRTSNGKTYVAKLDDGGSSMTATDIQNHFDSTNNPHSVTAAQVGADPVGTAAGVQSNLDTHAALRGNPHRVTAEQVGADPVGSASNVIDKLNAHKSDATNPHNVTYQQVGAEQAGAANAVKSLLNGHKGDTSNPHSVTAAQVGADPAGSADVVQVNLQSHAALRNNPHGVTRTQLNAERAGAAADVQSNLDLHIADTSNPHNVDASDVGADPAGSANAVDQKLALHITDETNPHNVTPADIGAAVDGHVHTATEVTSGQFANARISRASVRQHESAFEITESQITDLGSYAVVGHTHVEADVTDLDKYTQAQVDAKLLLAVPTAAVMPFALATAPSGWLACDGSAVSRTEYATLFNTIGTAYGVGDGSTTFNVPTITADDFIMATDVHNVLYCIKY